MKKDLGELLKKLSRLYHAKYTDFAYLGICLSYSSYPCYITLELTLVMEAHADVDKDDARKISNIS